MENKIVYISSNQITDEIKKWGDETSIYIAEINGDNIKKLSDYLSIMSEAFHFPFPSHSLDSYNDWMRDLDWLDKDGYILIIYNFNSFLSHDLASKRLVIDGFKKIILPFWQENVLKEVVEGMIKPFVVYVVD